MPAVGISGTHDGSSRLSGASNFDVTSVASLREAVSGIEYIIFHLFAGIDGASTAFESLHLKSQECKVIHLWFEVDVICQNFLRARSSKSHRLVTIADSQGIISSVFALTDGNCSIIPEFASSISSSASILVVAGSPCVGFSKANPSGQGINDPESSKMWVVPVLLHHLRKALPSSHIAFILENVPPKVAASKEFVSQTMQVQPILTHAHDCCPCRRSRLIWTNLPVSMEDLPSVSLSECLSSDWMPAWELSHSGETKFGTFLRPFEPGRPSEYPAKFHRFPLSSYDRSGLVVRKDLNRSNRSDISAKLQAIHEAKGDSRDRNSQAHRLRRELCEWIHLKGGEKLIRPLSASERFSCLGFPTEGIPDHQCSLFQQFPFLQASGNTFAVPIFVGLLRNVVTDIHQGSPIKCEALSFPLSNRAEALKALGSSSDCSGQSNRSRRVEPPTSTEHQVV